MSFTISADSVTQTKIYFNINGCWWTTVERTLHYTLWLVVSFKNDSSMRAKEYFNQHFKLNKYPLACITDNTHVIGPDAYETLYPHKCIRELSHYIPDIEYNGTDFPIVGLIDTHNEYKFKINLKGKILNPTFNNAFDKDTKYYTGVIHNIIITMLEDKSKIFTSDCDISGLSVTIDTEQKPLLEYNYIAEKYNSKPYNFFYRRIPRYHTHQLCKKFWIWCKDDDGNYMSFQYLWLTINGVRQGLIEDGIIKNPKVDRRNNIVCFEMDKSTIVDIIANVKDDINENYTIEALFVIEDKRPVRNRK